MKGFAVAKTFKARVEAEVGKGFLEENGILAIVSADDEGGMAPFPLQPTATGVQLLVKKEDLGEAIGLLKRGAPR